MMWCADLIRNAGAEPVVCEMWGKNKTVLEEKGYDIIADYFLSVTEGGYSAVCMNPPFSKGQDVDHVLHAQSLLEDGGQLVAIMSPCWIFRTDKRHTAFAEMVKEMNGVWEDVDAGAFSERDTNVRTGILHLTK